MIPTITLTNREQELGHLVVILSKLSKLPSGILTKDEKTYLVSQVEEHKEDLVTFNKLSYHVFICFVRTEKEIVRQLENTRQAGDKIAAHLNKIKAARVTLFDAVSEGDLVLALAEGMALGSYQFLKYKSVPEHENTLCDIEIYSSTLENAEEMSPASPQRLPGKRSSYRVSDLNTLIKAVFRCRDLINEPNLFLTATRFAQEVVALSHEAGVNVKVLDKQEITELKMGGLLGVNQGSFEPPTFTIMEWRPNDAKNKRPVVLVGKGVVYDTGGMNLKTGDWMLNMKDDMSGAAAVAAAIYAIAAARLPVYVVGLMPATDNRPGVQALVSGDIITMHSGKTVEVLNTDAEGRLLLADALSYAKLYNPALVIDLATLTGSAMRAVGKFAAAAMQSGAAEAMELLKLSGFKVNERLVEFPMWDEYGDQIKSDLADLKNSGPAEAGMITAGKFLENFTDYPFIHLDIAGPAFNEKADSYRGQGGTGFGVRLLFDFIQRLVEKPLIYD